MSFAYLMECFPDPTKTFVYREVDGMLSMGMEPAIFSIRTPSADERALMEGPRVPVQYLPPEAELRALIERERGDFSSKQRRLLSHWRAQKGDSTRVFEALWLGRELRQLRIRHVHAHFAGLAARTAWLVRELWGIGYSFTGHADDIFSPEQKPVSLGMLVRNARFIATETDYSRRRLEAEFSGARGKTFRVFNGIDADTAQGSALESDRNTMKARIVSVGRLVEKKGFPTLLAACALLKDRGLDFECDIVGAGPMDGVLRAELASLGLENHVVMHGLQPQSVVRSLLRSARVFALAARTEGDGGSDNLPTVIMEAMIAGIPVVSTRIAGIPEMVDDGETGFLVPSDDPVALAGAIEQLLSDSSMAHRLGLRGQMQARSKFSIERSVKDLVHLLVRFALVNPPPRVIRIHPTLRPSRLTRIKIALGLPR